MKKVVKAFSWIADDYTELQLLSLKEIMQRYPGYPWMQILSPFHSIMLFWHIERGLDNVEESMRQALSLYGNITSKLNWVLHIYSSADYDMEYLYRDLKQEYKLDGDALADAVVHKNDISYPFTVINKYEQEREVEDYILRDAISIDELDWAKEYVGGSEQEVNPIYIWNMNKSVYYKSRLEIEGE